MTTPIRDPLARRERKGYRLVAEDEKATYFVPEHEPKLPSLHDLLSDEEVGLARIEVPVVGHVRVTEHGVQHVRPHFREVDVDLGDPNLLPRAKKRKAGDDPDLDALVRLASSPRTLAENGLPDEPYWQNEGQMEYVEALNRLFLAAGEKHSMSLRAFRGPGDPKNAEETRGEGPVIGVFAQDPDDERRWDWYASSGKARARYEELDRVDWETGIVADRYVYRHEEYAREHGLSFKEERIQEAMRKLILANSDIEPFLASEGELPSFESHDAEDYAKKGYGTQEPSFIREARPDLRLPIEPGTHRAPPIVVNGRQVASSPGFVRVYDERYLPGLTLWAEDHGVDPQELLDQLAENARRDLEDQRVSVQVPFAVLGDALDDGRLRNQHDARNSHGDYEPAKRKRAESELFGVPVKGVKAKDRPIYGYVTDAMGSPTTRTADVTQYGTVTAVLRPEVRERTTVTQYDSLGRDVVAEPMNAPTWRLSMPPSGSSHLYAEGFSTVSGRAFGPDPSLPEPDDSVYHDPRPTVPLPPGSEGEEDFDQVDWRTVGPKRSYSRYIEAQIHGGVTLDDIDELVITKSSEVRFLEKKSSMPKGLTPYRDYEDVTYSDEQYNEMVNRLRDMGWTVDVSEGEIRAINPRVASPNLLPKAAAKADPDPPQWDDDAGEQRRLEWERNQVRAQPDWEYQYPERPLPDPGVEPVPPLIVGRRTVQPSPGFVAVSDRMAVDPIRQWSEKRGRDYHEVLAQMTDNVRREYASKKVALRVPHPIMADILSTGRVKNQHETRRSEGMYAPGKRKQIESEMFGYPATGVKGRDRPIYGYLGDADGDSFGVHQYGSLSIILKDDVRVRSTVTAHDSADRYATPEPLTAPTWRQVQPPAGSNDGERVSGSLRESIRSADWPNESPSKMPDSLLGYQEVQIHGGVTLDDIEEVVVSDYESIYVRDPQRLATHRAQERWLRERLTEAGIPWRVAELDPVSKWEMEHTLEEVKARRETRDRSRYWRTLALKEGLGLSKEES